MADGAQISAMRFGLQSRVMLQASNCQGRSEHPARHFQSHILSAY
jgi:hypothetical protein